MKKVILAATIAAMIVVSANAASFSWNSAGSVATPGVLPGGATITSGSIYAIVIWAFSSTIGTPSSGDALAIGSGNTILDATGGVAANGRVSSGGRTVTWGGTGYTMASPPSGVNATPTYLKDVADGGASTYNYYLRVYDASSISSATHYETLQLTSIATPATPSSGLTLSFGTVTQAGWTVLPTPEPCTLALGLVGVGALVLRRRFMKK